MNDYNIYNDIKIMRSWILEDINRNINNSKGNNFLKLKDLSMSKNKIILGKTPAMLYRWRDENDELVAEFKIWNWWDGINLSDLKITKKYRGNNLSYQLLDYATKNLGVKNLAVNKNNKIAKHVYDKYGFKVVDEDNELYYMSLNRKKKGGYKNYE